MEEYNNRLPDFYSVRNQEQIDYSFDGMEGKKCFLFFDNGFTSNIVEPNNRDMRFIWDGFYLFVDQDTTLSDIQSGIDLYDSRLVALQRTNVLGNKSNNREVREYIVEKLKEMNIPFEIMNDANLVDGYPTSCDLWSTRDMSVLIDAMDTVGEGKAYYYQSSFLKFKISFNESGIPTFTYNHNGALVLKGSDTTAISRLVENDENLKSILENIIKDNKIYSSMQDRYLNGIDINAINRHVR